VAEIEIARTRGRVGRFVAWLAVIVVIMAVAAAALISERIWVATAAVIGLAAAWLLVRIGRLFRRRPRLAWTIVAALAVLGCVSVFFATVIRFNSAGIVELATVPYHATGQLDGDAIVLREEITPDNEAVVPVSGGWQQGPAVDGRPTFVRTRTVRPTDSHFFSTTMSFLMDLGRARSVGLVAREGSRIELTSQKGALVSAYPAASTVIDDPRRPGSEVTTISIDRYVESVSLAVMKKPLRNPAGQKLYQISAWQPLPWAVGILFGLVTSILGDKIKQLLGLAARKALRARRRPPQQRAESESTTANVD
jgi:hypothetical protein